VNSYGKGNKEKIDFADLLIQVNRVKGIRRIRFTTSHPKDLSDKLIDQMARLDKVCEHLHLPVQSGSNKILSRMKRGYTREYYQNLVNKLRQAIPGITLTTDIIVGFPGEEEEDFRDTLELVETVGFDGAFTFCYSPLRGTEAAQLEERIPAEISGERLRRLIELQQAILLKKNESLVGRKFEVMVEGISKKNLDEVGGRTRGNKIIIFPGGKNLIGRFIGVEIVKAGCWALRGMVLS
jgi:tRNA-2-methylthio-N6-dimethylallyladenosine synthase